MGDPLIMLTSEDRVEGNQRSWTGLQLWISCHLHPGPVLPTDKLSSHLGRKTTLGRKPDLMGWGEGASS